MKLNKTQETIFANLIFWGAIAGAIALAIAFPIAAIIILLVILISK